MRNTAKVIQACFSCSGKNDSLFSINGYNIFKKNKIYLLILDKIKFIDNPKNRGPLVGLEPMSMTSRVTRADHDTIATSSFEQSYS